MPSVLISGASIAGPTLAFWLRHHGFDVTVIERAPALRPGGQPVDIRGTALDVIERMGLAARVMALRTRMAGVDVLDRHGTELRRHTDRTLTAGRHDSGDVEIFRDDLASLLFEAIGSTVEVRFDDRVVALDDGPDTVAVSFARGGRRDFDLVIGADGLYSGVRRLAFGPHEQVLQPLGATVGIFTAPNVLGLRDWQTAVDDPNGGLLVLPARGGTELRVFMTIDADPPGRDLTVPEQKALLRDRFAGFGWETPRLLDLLDDAPDLYFGAIAQVHMPSWARGRVCLVGDAACCPSPRSGQGTSVALVGSYVLADELGRDPRDHVTAFARYESRMRPFVHANQALAFSEDDEATFDAVLMQAKSAIAL